MNQHFNLFVLGKSQCGKSTFSRKFCELNPEFQHIQGSEWIKAKHPEFVDTTQKNYREKITEASMKAIQENPNACVEFINQKYDLTKPTVVEGLRSPYDFMKLFDASKDYVLILDDCFAGSYPAFLDQGVEKISELVVFLNTICVVKKSQLHIESYTKIAYDKATDTVNKNESMHEWAQRVASRYQVVSPTELTRISDY